MFFFTRFLLSLIFPRLLYYQVTIHKCTRVSDAYRLSETRYQEKSSSARRILRRTASALLIRRSRCQTTVKLSFKLSTKFPGNSHGSAIANCSASTAFTDRCNRCPSRDARRARAPSAHSLGTQFRSL